LKRGCSQREKQLPVDDALRIAREVADALSYPHGVQPVAQRLAFRERGLKPLEKVWHG